MADIIWDHVHLRTSDPEATAQWFERMFGAEIKRSMQQGKPRIDLKLGGASVFMYVIKPGDVVNPAPVAPFPGIDHFALRIKGLDAFAAELKAKGVEFIKEPNTPRPGLRACFIRGPEKISVELVDRDEAYR